MRNIGFSTGALAFSDFKRGLRIMVDHSIRVIELSALRQRELLPLTRALDGLELSTFDYVSVHAPSRIARDDESTVCSTLRTIANNNHWPIIVHPDAIMSPNNWGGFGEWLCIENMDKRKSTGRTAAELEQWFDIFPEASFCFDIGHAHQVDPTMTEAHLLLKRFADRIRQVHMSHVASSSAHGPLSWSSIYAFRQVASRIPAQVPIVLESVIPEQYVDSELRQAARALSPDSDTGSEVVAIDMSASATHAGGQSPSG